MPVYLYCLVAESERPAVSIRGIDGAPVQTIGEGPLHAWVSTVETRLVTPSVERAQAHDGVVRAAMEDGTPVPARFGQTFDDEGSLLALLRDRGADVAAMLARVAGCVEMTVQLVLPPQDVAPAERDGEDDRGERELPGSGPGRVYLEGLARRQRIASDALRRAEFLQLRIAQAAKDLIRESSPPTYTPSTHTVSLSHLIARQAVSRYRHVLHGLGERGDADSRAVISGPWAPYSFVELRHD
ncbi:MAG TPA: GvpL/GvpF family gas vesicle protein [Gemmatimonadaceae bacterium]|nr:GvpL/GvpF family gas vesicle protein [Gemmatimonadaceae bacterium]